ncbi:MAG: hypothetical protein LKM44_00840 [Wolbachia endosymbiont of Meromenopon meropis]|nr:hypothetical protein [Wolbachia endosymbiont of Meromenopon meropis]
MRKSGILEITAELFVLIFTIFLVYFAINKFSGIRKNYKGCYENIWFFLLTLMYTSYGDSVSEFLA